MATSHRSKLIADKLRELSPSVMEGKVLELLKKHEETAMNMNTDQLFQGEGVDGSLLPDYSQRSVEVFGKPQGPWRLFETGDFYRGFIFQNARFPLEIVSHDSKEFLIAEKLENAGYDSTKIYGLNNENLEDISRQYILPDLQAILHESVRV
jgi:hypothetical protein